MPNFDQHLIALIVRTGGILMLRSINLYNKRSPKGGIHEKVNPSS